MRVFQWSLRLHSGTGLAIAAWLMACGCIGQQGTAPAASSSQQASAPPPQQILYSTGETGQIGTTQTTVTAFRVGPDGSLLSLGTAFQLGPGVTTWETLSLQMADATGHHVFAIESVALLQSPFTTTYSLITFSVQPDTGALQQVSSVPLPGEPTTVELNPAGTLMFIGLFGANPTSIATYSVDRAGTLTLLHTAIPGFQFAVYGTAINPAGTFLYAIGGGLHGDGFGIQFAIDPTGALTQVGNFDGAGAHVGGSPGAGEAPIVVTPSGRTLYTLGMELLKTFAVDPTTGQLTEGTALSCNCFNLTMNATGNLLYAGTYSFLTPNQPVGISLFSIDPVTEALTPLNQPFIPIAPPDPSVIFTPWFVLDASGNFLYATTFDLGNILGFSIANLAAVTPVPGSPFPQPGGNSPALPLGAGINLTLVKFQP